MAGQQPPTPPELEAEQPPLPVVAAPQPPLKEEPAPLLPIVPQVEEVLVPKVEEGPVLLPLLDALDRPLPQRAPDKGKMKVEAKEDEIDVKTRTVTAGAPQGGEDVMPGSSSPPLDLLDDMAFVARAAARVGRVVPPEQPCDPMTENQVKQMANTFALAALSAEANPPERTTGPPRTSSPPRCPVCQLNESGLELEPFPHRCLCASCRAATLVHSDAPRCSFCGLCH